MDFNEKQGLILNYLDKNYIIKENNFFRRYDDVHEWGVSIAYSLSKIFSFDEDFCHMQLKYWSEKNNLSETDWQLAYGPHKLKTQWSLEMANDLQVQYGVSNAEEQLINMLSAEIAREIDSEILKKLKGKLKTQDEFLSVMKCIGYEATPPLVDPNTFRVQKRFVSMNYNDIKNERQINTHWKDWIRPSEQG
jgi:hypothetical protein